MAAPSVLESSDNVLQNIARHINCLAEENRNIRKRALEGIQKETFGRKTPPEPSILQTVFKTFYKDLLKLLSDPVEKCRELTINLVANYFNTVPQPDEILPYLMPVLVQRLGQLEIGEPSEELRLLLVKVLTNIVNKTPREKLAIYLDDAIRILQRAIMDTYQEVKKESCKCASELAKKVPQQFHMQSASLIKPLLCSVSHQHSRVRVAVIETIGVVLQNGDNKYVDDVVSHLAQRLFDQAPTVRTAVTNVVGNWLLDLYDRYSFFHKLIPLLLTSLTDELPEIRELADGLWHDVGIKYLRENETDLKDHEDFAKPDPTHYPTQLERPNLGCRTLMFRNVSKILPGLVRDLGDWVRETRIKSAQLFYTLIWNSEDYMTQHMVIILNGLYKACADEEKEVFHYASMAAEMLGYFVEPDMWCHLVLGNVKSMQTYGSLMVLANILKGSERTKVQPKLVEICDVLTDPEVCHTVQMENQRQLLCTVEALINVMKEDCSAVSFQLFTILNTVLALSNAQEIAEKVKSILECLALTQGSKSIQSLYNAYTRQLISTFENDYQMWTNHSVERALFDTLLLESGPVVGEILSDVIPVVSANLNPDKDPELRLKFFSLLSRLMMNATNTLDSQNRFGDFAITVVKDMILPNCVWKAGRTAGAIRTTAVSCLWALLKSQIITREKLLPIIDDLVTQLVSLMDDDVKTTRLVTCRVLTHLFSIMGRCMDQDKLHFMYPELLKRMDDADDDIRVAVTKSFLEYFDCFKEGYEVNLYRAHLEEIYRGLLVHLDDPDERIQQSVLDVLKKASLLKPEMLMTEIETVQHKHRTTRYCQSLIQHIQGLTV